jgi:micrococcal nuclease
VASGRTFRCALAVLVLVSLTFTATARAQRPSAPAAKAATPPNAEQPARDLSQLPSFKVVRVVDAANIVVMMDPGPQAVRLIGIDSPQTAPGLAKDVRDRLGKEAAQRLTGLIQGKPVYLESEEPGQYQTDAAGNVQAYIYRNPDGLFLNQELVTQGLARASAKHNYRLFDAFQASEQTARAGKLGLWAEPPAAPAAKTKASASAVKDVQPDTFVVMPGSKKYHRESCRLVANGGTSVTLAEAKEKKLEPCLVCKPGQAAPAAKAGAATTVQIPKKKRYQSQDAQRKMLDQSIGNIDPTAGGEIFPAPY